MSQFFHVHPERPQRRLCALTAQIIRDGGVGVYPTDSTYALGCKLDNAKALDRIRSIRGIDDKHLLSLICRDLSELANYARVDNSCYRLLRRNTPGPFTFILEATRDVPRKVSGSKRRTIGLRIPDSKIVQSVIGELGEPLLSTSLILPDEELARTDPLDIRQSLEHEVDVIIDGGIVGSDQTTLVDLTGETPKVARAGIGQLVGHD